MPRLIDLTVPRVCWSARKTTSSGNTWTPKHIGYRSLGGATLWRNGENRVEGSSSSRLSCTRSKFAILLHFWHLAEFQGSFFFLLQSEDGDLFKVWIEHEGEEVKSLRIKYFDTVPVTASLCILKAGYLFAASEFGDQ